ncbi:trehalose-phosphatase [Kineococcus sp. TBRC 1896]|uniref:Trehalose 6-phosphate phosphatase n=1 Tax=Kineococcus mangrovi TaxID=1660183 RepID=A0ABV4I226_9ACTN
MSTDLDAALASFAARGRVLVALDFDGVLSPLVDDPSAARPLPEAAQALDRLVPSTDVALVSGRHLDDLRACAAPPDAVVLVGGHGTQSSLEGAAGGQSLDDAESALLERLGDELDRLTADVGGAHVERKPMSVVLHTRRASRPDAERLTRAVLDGPATWEGVHVLRGKEVVELGAVELGKGAGLTRLRDRLSADGPAVEAVLFAGDDVTDEDAFAVLDPASGDVTVKVGQDRTAAAFRVEGPPDVAALLHRLADLRST